MFSWPTWKRLSLSSIAFAVLLFNVAAFVTCAPLALAAVLLVKTKLNVLRCYSLASTIIALLTITVPVNAATADCRPDAGWFEPDSNFLRNLPPTDPARRCDPDVSNGKVDATLTEESCEIALKLQSGSELRFDISVVLDEQKNCNVYRKNLFTMSASNTSKACDIQFSILPAPPHYQLQAAGPGQDKKIVTDGFDGTVGVILNSNGDISSGGRDPVKTGCQLAYCGSNTVRVTLRGGEKIKTCGVKLTFNQATFVLDRAYLPTTTAVMNTTAVTAAKYSHVKRPTQSPSKSNQPSAKSTGLAATHWIIIYACSGAVGLFIFVCMCCCVIICISSSRSRKRRAAQAAANATKSAQQSTNTSPEHLTAKPQTGPKKSSASNESQTADKDHSEMVTERIFTEPNKPPLSGHGALERTAADQQKPLGSPKPRRVILPGEKRMQATADYNTMNENDVQSDWVTEDKAIGGPNKVQRVSKSYRCLFQKQATVEIKKTKTTQTTQKFTETTQNENEDAGSPHKAARSPDDGSAQRRGSGSRRNDEALRTRSTILDTLGPSRDRTTQQTREQTGEKPTQATVNKSQG
ncbi:hypothetical protein AAVH_09251 [Aphelenchoides avenae]|nr:hypothetical protein AAVH_09251 [Aphelenchus avenae]